MLVRLRSSAEHLCEPEPRRFRLMPLGESRPQVGPELNSVRSVGMSGFYQDSEAGMSFSPRRRIPTPLYNSDPPPRLLAMRLRTYHIAAAEANQHS
ncbi:unnamed protein product, partial [Mycena citricolor]